MKNKLAIWSWILPIIGFVLYLIVGETLDQVMSAAGVGFMQQKSVLVIFSFTFLSIAMIGFYLVSAGLRRVKNNPELSGKTHASVGIVLNILLSLFTLLGFASGLFA